MAFTNKSIYISIYIEIIFCDNAAKSPIGWWWSSCYGCRRMVGQCTILVSVITPVALISVFFGQFIRNVITLILHELIKKNFSEIFSNFCLLDIWWIDLFYNIVKRPHKVVHSLRHWVLEISIKLDRGSAAKEEYRHCEISFISLIIVWKYNLSSSNR